MHDFIYFKADKLYFQLKHSEILYVKAEKKHVEIFTTEKKYLCPVSISQIEKYLPRQSFCRIHRSYIISFRHLRIFDNEIAYVGKNKLPIAEQFIPILKRSLPIVNYDQKNTPEQGGNIGGLLHESIPE